MLKFYILGFFTTIFASTVDLTPYLDKPFRVSHKQVGVHPVILDYSYQDFNQTFAEFIPGDELQVLSDRFEWWLGEFLNSKSVGPWRGSGYKFGIFDGSRATHKKQRLIKGTNCKMCYEFIDWILENKTISKTMHRLLNQLIKVDAIAQKEFSKVMDGIADLSYLYKGKSRLPVTLRLIRFERSDCYSLPLHFDISVLSLVFPSNDKPHLENFIMAPADGRPFEIHDLRRAYRPQVTDSNKTCGLLLAGSQISQ